MDTLVSSQPWLPAQDNRTFGSNSIQSTTEGEGPHEALPFTEDLHWQLVVAGGGRDTFLSGVTTGKETCSWK